MNNRMKYSVVFLLEDHNKYFVSFLNGMNAIFASRHDSFEFIIIANGTGGFLKGILQTQSFDCEVKAFEMSRSSQAACLKAIVNECKGEVLVICGSYQQITFESFEQLIDSVDNDTDIIIPRRQNRHDPFVYTFQSRIFNTIVRRMTRTDAHDLSCNVKIFRREVLERTELYGNMYRFLPIFAIKKGFRNKYVMCEHYKEHGEPRRARGGFYFLSEYINRIIDIFTIYFNISFTKKPLRFFSSIGFVLSLISFIIIFFIIIQKMLYGIPLGNRLMLILAIFLLLLGIQSIGAGLLGEIIVFTYGRKKKEYVIEKII